MALPRRVSYSLRPALIFTLLIWIVFLFEWVLGARWSYLGVLPRHEDGLWGILFSPMLHGDWGHLLSNTPPLFALTFLLFFFYRRIAWSAFGLVYLLSGVGLWLFGREVYHIGASGVIYGLVALLAWNGIFRRNVKSIAIALVVVVYYGGMFAGILPGETGVSWDGHLLGALAGILTAWVFRGSIERDEEKRPASYELEPPAEPESFFSPDTFDKTRREREQERFWQDLEKTARRRDQR